ncbi:MAG TPA: kelch repeat-containing protein, partial [Tepidisphaeraceae bacterium]
LAAANNGKLYAIGGNPASGPGILATVEEYDPATDTWATRANMPTARAGLAVAAASNGKIYAIGGSVGASVVNTVEEYDPATNTWATQTSLTVARTSLGATAASNGRLYAIGGDSTAGAGSYVGTNEEGIFLGPLGANYVKVEKFETPNPALVGGVVSFTVKIILGGPRNGLTLDDTLSNVGQAPATQYVSGSAVLDGAPLGTPPTLVANQPNRVEYAFTLGSLGTGVHTFTYQMQLSNAVGCFATASNGANLDQAGVTGHIATATMTFPVRC